MFNQPLSRRHTLKGFAGAGAAAALLPGVVRAEEMTVLRARTLTDLKSLDPPLRSSPSDSDVVDAIYSRLIAFRPGDEWRWDLDAAEMIEQIDETRIAFRLRPGIRWTGGYGEMTAEDVKFSFERVIDPDLGAWSASDWSALDHVEVTGDLEGVIVLQEYFAPLWWSTLPWHTAAIVCKQAVEDAGGTFTTDPPATSGRYMLKDWQPNQRIVLGRNPDYYGPPAGFDEIHLLPIDDENAAELAFVAGEIDFTRIPASSLPRLREDPPEGGVLVIKPTLDYTWLGMNVDNPVLQDIRIRRAIQQAVDVDQILEAAYFGAALPATGIIGPGLLGHRDIEPPKPDPDAARALIAEAGAEGLVLTLDILASTTNAATAQIIQSNLADIGVEVSINQNDAGHFWSLGSESAGDMWKDVQLILNTYNMAPDPSWATAWFTCDQVGVWNWERWCDQEFSDLNASALTETDDAKRDEIYQHMQSLMWDSGAYAFITHGVAPSLHRDTVKPALLPDGTRFRLGEFEPA